MERLGRLTALRCVPVGEVGSRPHNASASLAMHFVEVSVCLRFPYFCLMCVRAHQRERASVRVYTRAFERAFNSEHM